MTSFSHRFPNVLLLLSRGFLITFSSPSHHFLIAFSSLSHLSHRFHIAFSSLSHLSLVAFSSISRYFLISLIAFTSLPRHFRIALSSSYHRFLIATPSLRYPTPNTNSNTTTAPNSTPHHTADPQQRIAKMSKVGYSTEKFRINSSTTYDDEGNMIRSASNSAVKAPLNSSYRFVKCCDGCYGCGRTQL
jgi:hypothetical protein